MNELIKIQDYNGKKAVSARELHEFLESKKDFSSWIKHRIGKYGLIENVDYVTLPQMGEPDNHAFTNPNPRIEYALTIDAAKELSMVEGNVRGKEARKYFIECERKAKENRLAVPTSTLDILKLAVRGLEEQQRGLDEVKKEVRELRAATKTTPDYFAIMGYAALNKIQIGLTLAASLGRKAKRICEMHGYPVESIPDPRFGRVHTYPYSVLERVFNESIV